MIKRGNCLIAQSGGPTAVINASAFGVAKEFMNHGINVYAGTHGVQGIMEERLLDLSKIGGAELERLKYMPSAGLGSCRYKLADNAQKKSGDYEKLLGILDEYDIEYFFYIGGNDSMDSAYKIHRYAKEMGLNIKVMGVPKTIDNDLEITDHCPGFGSAAKYVANTALEVWYDIMSYPKKQVAVIEVMGRDTGWIAAAAALAQRKVPGLEMLIYVPEVAFDRDRFQADIERAVARSGKVIVVASEGIKFANGSYINLGEETDSFGHVKLGGVSKTLRRMIRGYIDIDVRAIELGVMQRCAMHCVSAQDLLESEIVGREAAKFALDGESGYMSAIIREEASHYHWSIQKAPLSEVRNRVKFLPGKYIGEDLCSVTDEYIDYVAPLVAGKVDVFDDDGLITGVHVDMFRR